MFNEQNFIKVESVVSNIKENISNNFEQEHGILGFGLSQETLISLEDLF